ncbi:MAG: UDP-N-acetylmuramate dehydrogenase [Candidatus Gastranaerophilales bacterium]|nr:UDP-N-acetylmuramate dehydrogenase [Candidatus Gastranaerophilales bacterium]
MKEIEHKTNISLAPYNTLRIDCTAEDVYFPNSIKEFTLLLANLDNPLVIGRGSNTLLSSKGIKRPVILTKHLNKVEVNSPSVTVESGASAAKLAEMALELKLSGIEFLSALPATIGGAVCMNAGANGQNISDCFVSSCIYDSEEDKIKNFTKEDMQFSYRNTILKNQERYFLLNARFELKESASYEEIEKLMKENREKRKEFQPDLGEPNLGCVFKNPENNSAGRLLDECSLKSKPVGGAMVSRKHANFIINFNNATSTDYLNLMKEMQDKVEEKFKIRLHPEIIYAGDDKYEEDIWNKIIK